MPRLRPPHLLLTSLLLLGASSAWAQDRGSISGRVVDKRTNHAIPFASVGIVGIQKGGLTDSEGRFLISGIPAGTYEVKVQYLGYKTDSRPGVVVTGGKSISVDFQLEDVVVHEEKAVEVSAERRLVEVRQGATVRSVNANEIRNLPVATISDVLQQQAGISADAEQIHVRGGRADETIFVVNGVANRDLVTGQSTAGNLNARSVAEVNVATGAYDVRYGNALSGVVDVRLKEGTERFSGGITTTAGSYGGKALQMLFSGPDPLWTRLLGTVGLRPSGSMTAVVDVSMSGFATRFPNVKDQSLPRLASSYEDGVFGMRWRYGDFFSPTQDNNWAARYGLTWKPNSRDKVSFDFSKRIAADQGFSRVFINASGDAGDPAYPWRWSHRIGHAPTIFEDNVQTSLEWRRTFSQTGFTSLHLSRYFFAQRQDVEGKYWGDFVEPDDRALPDSVQRNDFFIDSGDDNTWQDRRTQTYGIEWNLVQRYKRHELEVGFEHQSQSVQYMTIEDPWVFDPNGLGGAHDLWLVHPWVGDVYVRDRLEYEGFTANVGLRADYWFAGREAEQAIADTSNENISPVTRTSFYENTTSVFGRRMKMHISPRIIVAHPITENSSFFFNYGQFTQNPSYRYVYSKLTSISSESFPLLGNPDLNPQVSINYELGAKHQFLPSAAVNATFFVKDVYDYPTATTFKRQQGTSLVDVFVYLNGHFARSKGFEVVLEKRRTSWWSGRISYTYQQTRGKSSDPNEQKIVQEGGGDAAETRLSEAFVRWNRPNKLAANLDMRYTDQAPRSWLKHSGLNVYAQGQSGRAYTPINVYSNQAAEPYSKNAIFQSTVDLKANKAFVFGRQRLDFSLAALNVFGTRVIYRVDRVTGRGRVWGEGEYDPAVFPDLNEYVKVSEVDDPSNYGAGRTWRLALDVDF